MKNWNTEWRELRRTVAAHGSPETVERDLIRLAEAVPEFVTPCPTCKVTAGPCQSKSGRPSETHSMRLHRAKVTA